ncbi:hypothetical protein CF319_g1234 [Tilletia indica]|nr:hypothetical protein CF319_g1234 [Tilletia indica]
MDDLSVRDLVTSYLQPLAQCFPCLARRASDDDDTNNNRDGRRPSSSSSLPASSQPSQRRTPTHDEARIALLSDPDGPDNGPGGTQDDVDNSDAFSLHSNVGRNKPRSKKSKKKSSVSSAASTTTASDSGGEDALSRLNAEEAALALEEELAVKKARKKAIAKARKKGLIAAAEEEAAQAARLAGGHPGEEAYGVQGGEPYGYYDEYGQPVGGGPYAYGCEQPAGGPYECDPNYVQQQHMPEQQVHQQPPILQTPDLKLTMSPPASVSGSNAGSATAASATSASAPPSATSAGPPTSYRRARRHERQASRSNGSGSGSGLSGAKRYDFGNAIRPSASLLNQTSNGGGLPSATSTGSLLSPRSPVKGGGGGMPSSPVKGIAVQEVEEDPEEIEGLDEVDGLF